jgi:hypothetical protein
MATCTSCEGDCTGGCSGSCIDSCAGSCANGCGNNCASNCLYSCSSTASQNANLSETDLLTVLGVSSISAAISALRTRCTNNNFSNLALGMYLDLPNFTVNGTNYSTQRIVIAGFNTFKNINGYNAANHIVFAFKNIVGLHTMNLSDTNTGGYPATSMRTFLEDGDFGFLAGIINSIGNYVYSVNRLISTKGAFSWNSNKVWLPTENEVFGSIIYSEPNASSSSYSYMPIIPLYNSFPAYRKKTRDGSTYYWWLASPNASYSHYFCFVYTSGMPNLNSASSSYGVSPCFCLS